MKVALVASTQLSDYMIHCVDPPLDGVEDIVEFAGRVCYRTTDKMGANPNFVQKRIDQGHLSLLRHVNFTFLVEGISRSCSHQIVRHQAGCSYSQESQRYAKLEVVEITDEAFVYPPDLKPYQEDELDTIFWELHDSYQKLVERGMKPEDARCILPNATKTRILITMNGQALRHFITIRGLNPAAQREIREVALEMLFAAHKVAPKLFDDLTKG